MSSTGAAASGLTDLVECLEAEYRALLANDLQRLESVLARKQQLLGELALAPLPGTRGDRPGGSASWQQGLARVRDLNLRNALVLAPRATAIRARLRFLQAALGQDGLYAADGSLASGGLRAPAARGA